VGIRFAQFTLDYAISPFGELGDTHVFTLTTNFGGAAKESLQKPFGATEYLEEGTNPVGDDRTIVDFGAPAKANWWDSRP
jgi:hypothetical protein